jgi:hypothetical protein
MSDINIMPVKDMEAFLHYLQDNKAILCSNATGINYTVVLNRTQNRVTFPSRQGYRDCPVTNLWVTKDHRGFMSINGMTSVNGWGNMNSPFEAVIYFPLSEINSELLRD